MTTCAPIDKVWEGVNGLDIGLGIVGAIGVLMAGIMGLVIALSAAAATPPTLAIAAVTLMMSCLMVINTINQARNYAFNYKLACIGENRCAIAFVHSMEMNVDGDLAINVVLAPATDQTEEKDYKNMFQAAELVYTDPGVGTRGWNFGPHENGRGDFGKGLPLLHCEIEGSYLDDWTKGLLAYLWLLFALAVAALILATTLTALGPIGWAIAGAVFLLLLLAALFAGHMLGDEEHLSGAEGDPIGISTPDPSGPVITDVGGQSVNVGDFIVMIGRHVCDTGHHGEKGDPTGRGVWDELHPVLGITKLRPTEYLKIGTTHTSGDLYDKYCESLQAFINRTAPPVVTLEHPYIG